MVKLKNAWYMKKKASIMLNIYLRNRMLTNIKK